MECIYIPELTVDHDVIDVPQQEEQHVKALRLNSGDQILAVNGKGLECICEIRFKGKHAFLNIFGKAEALPPKYITVAFGLILDKERMEYLIEKCTEIGVSEFQPLITKHTQRKNFKTERFVRKAIAAMKQSQRAILPKINEPMKLEEYMKNQKGTIIITDYAGSTDYYVTEKKAIVLIGPEGGFSPEEIERLKNKAKYNWRISDNRLRTETAAVVAATFAISQ
ncbi:MAG: 16S rRNA (uracil(1498)-N(3))-methyltransferase [Ignavibacteria bacterium]|nr:16S rRNA (uracil(1498)-N(3))-methyltransferase [Ignavibacteria bacterium]